MNRRRTPEEQAENQQPRALRGLQRQRLIDACISALHIHGPSKTTVEKVVAIAQMSPGIVRFYFDSKDALLVASLEFLATEFEDNVLLPITARCEQPVEALKALVELYLSADIASTRKVSVWYSFWGEASSRQEYLEICGARDAKFERLVNDLIGRVIATERITTFNTDAIALGLIGVLELLWQSFAFQPESSIDRDQARTRAMAYLSSIFPTAFTEPVANAQGRLSEAAYTRVQQLPLERAGLFRHSWQCVGLAAELSAPGHYLTLDGAYEPVLVLKTADGTLRAYQNLCPSRSHILLMARQGQIAQGIHCELHGLQFDAEGTAQEGGLTLSPLEVLNHQGLVFVRSHSAPGKATPLPALDLPKSQLTILSEGGQTSVQVSDTVVAADWKIGVELWLERAATLSHHAWDQRTQAEPGRTGQYLAPNQWLETTASGCLLSQWVPLATGQSRLRQFHIKLTPAGTRESPPPNGQPDMPNPDIQFAESMQRSLELRLGSALGPEWAPDALLSFHQSIAALSPGGPKDAGDLS
jgi:TetR/AcrR family transcriptional repressor of bet genes